MGSPRLSFQEAWSLRLLQSTQINTSVGVGKTYGYVVWTLYIQQGYILFTFSCLSTYSLESDDSRQSLDYLETVLLLLEVVLP